MDAMQKTIHYNSDRKTAQTLLKMWWVLVRLLISLLQTEDIQTEQKYTA